MAYVTRKPEGSKLPLRKGRATKSMYFWKSAEGGGSFSIQKFMLLILGTLNRAFEHGIDKNKSNFRVEGMFYSTIVLILTDTIWPMLPCINVTISIIKICNIIFPK